MTAEPKILGNGSYKPRNLGAGMLVAEEVDPITLSCFAMATRG